LPAAKKEADHMFLQIDCHESSIQ